MKKLLWVGMAALLLAVSGCSGNSLDGDWPSMVWKAEQAGNPQNGKEYAVSPHGSTLSFVCTNYGSPWFAGAQENGTYILPDYEARDYGNIKGDWFGASIDGNRFSVTFLPNDTQAERSVAITVTAGDIFHTFKFCQSATQTEATP